MRETLRALRRRFGNKRRLLAVYDPRSATSRRRTFQTEFVAALQLADEVVIGRPFDTSKIPEDERFDPERLALDLHRAGTKAAHIPDVDAMVAHLAQAAAPGDVVVVLSSGSADGVHDKLLDAIGDAIRPARRQHMPEARAVLAAAGIPSNTAADEHAAAFFVLHNEAGLVGCVALEVLGDDAVLHSLAVTPEVRGVGYGWMLADTAISEGRHRGVRHIYLVTTDAADFFAAKFGFRVVDRSTVSPAVNGTAAFQRGTSDRLVAMRLDL